MHPKLTKVYNVSYKSPSFAKKEPGIPRYSLLDS